MTYFLSFSPYLYNSLEWVNVL